MKTQSLLGWMLVCGFCLLHAVSARGAETLEPAAAPSEPSPELIELRQKLGAIERSNKEVAEKWEAVIQQNATLSNVLTGLQQTLTSQREKEIELSRQAHAFTLKVIGGAAAAVFLVFLLSYWFQLRALNRVMEISGAVLHPGPQGPALLGTGAAPNSTLLAAIKGLEGRVAQLEVPGHGANGAEALTSTHTTNASSNLLHVAPLDSTAPSSVSLLLAKGQTLLDMDRLQDALGCFQEALILDPENAEAFLKKGIALERLNRLEPALSAFEEAVRLNPKRAIAHASKARILAALHRYDEAIAVYDSALGKNGPKSSTPIFVS